DQRPHELLVDRVVHEHSLAAEAGLAGIPVAADDDGLDRGVDIGIGAHDHGVAAAELERDALQLGSGEARDVAADGGGAGEGDTTYIGVAYQRVADLRSTTGDDVEYAIR